MRKCEIQHIKWSKKLGQEINFPLHSLVKFFLTLNVKSSNCTRNLFLYSLSLCTKQKHALPYELAQPSHRNKQCPVGLTRLALRSAPPMQTSGKLRYIQFGRREWFWSSLLLHSKQEVISIGAEDTKLNLGKAMEMFGMESKHTSPKDLALWTWPEDVRLVGQTASFTELTYAAKHHEYRKSRKSR